MSDTPRKALIYCRVSDPKQKIEGHWLESQEHRCRQFAAEKGLSVEAEPFLDDVTGGGNFNKRPAMNDLLDYLKCNKETDYVVVFDDIKRFSRDIYFYWDLIYKLEEYNAEPMSPNFRFEKTPEGRFQQSITVAAGEYERESIARQTKQKTKARLEAGYHAFIAPAGFKYKKTKEQGKVLVRDEPAASAIAEMMEGFASGRFQTKRECKYFLEGAPEYPKKASGKIGHSQVDAILGNPLYAGYIEYKPWGVDLRKGKHEGMVSYETFCRIQDRLKGRAHAPARKDLNKDFPLRGAVFCECGNQLTAAWSKSRTGKHHPYYLCQNRKCAYKGKSIRKDMLEGAFEELLAKLQPSRELVLTAEKMFCKLWDHRGRAQGERQKLIEQEITQTQRKIDQMLDRIVELENGAAISAFEARIEKLQKNKMVLEEKLEHCGRPLKPYDQMYRTAMQFLASPHKIWACGGLTEKRTVIKLTFTDRLIWDRKTGYRTPDLSLPFKCLSDLNMQKMQMVPRPDLKSITNQLINNAFLYGCLNL